MALLCKDVKDPAVLALAEGCTALAHLANDEPWMLEMWGEVLKQIMIMDDYGRCHQMSNFHSHISFPCIST